MQENTDMPLLELERPFQEAGPIQKHVSHGSDRGGSQRNYQKGLGWTVQADERGDDVLGDTVYNCRAVKYIHLKHTGWDLRE